MSIKKDGVSPLTISLIDSLVKGSALEKSQVQVKDAKRGNIEVVFADPHNTAQLEKSEDGKEVPQTLTKSILNILNGGHGNSIERLAFETNPGETNTYAALYRSKLRLLPDHILKRIAIQDSLVAAIVNARSAQIQAFGRPQPDRHSTGFLLDPKAGVLDKMKTPQQKDEFQKRIEKAERLLVTCGHTSQLRSEDQLTFSQFLGMTARNAVTVGRIAVEVIWVLNPETQKMEAHHFRPIDAGTIYMAAPYTEAAESVRREALHLLEQLKNKDFSEEKFKADEYAWVQVVEGSPRQVFTSNECLVHNFYPVSDVELDGYPVTPIDTAIADITTHINITTHNKLYFQTGRAARGMLVIMSDDVDERVLQQIKQQFNASINSVNNAWRMPVFGVGKEDQISWQPIDTGSRDMEFQYLSDTNSRVILSAFQMSPEELPGYAHLSRGTNNQALSESNNEYKLEAHRDVGIRPLISNFEDFVNARLLPLIDPTLSELVVVKFVGLDAETPEKESIRLQGDMPVHMTYDEVLQTVEKDPVGMEMGGEIPLNPAYQQLLDKYFTVGEILSKFCGKKEAEKDPSLAYFRDPFWFQMQQMAQQAQQMQQQAQQQPQGGQPPPDGGGGQPPPQGGADAGPPPDQQQPPQDGEASQSSSDGAQSDDQGQDLTRSLDQVIDLLSKSESELPPSRRRLLQQHRRLVDRGIAEFQKDLDKVLSEALIVADDFTPKKE